MIAKKEIFEVQLGNSLKVNIISPFVDDWVKFPRHSVQDRSSGMEMRVLGRLKGRSSVTVTDFIATVGLWVPLALDQ